MLEELNKLNQLLIKATKMAARGSSDREIELWHLLVDAQTALGRLANHVVPDGLREGEILKQATTVDNVPGIHGMVRLALGW